MAVTVELSQKALPNLLIDELQRYLTLKLSTEVTDLAKAGLVRSGKLQDDPTAKKTNILIHPGGKEWPDVLNTASEQSGYVGYTYTMGTGYSQSQWRIRFRIELQLFYVNEANRDNSRAKSLLILARAKHALSLMPLRAIPRDDFGEKAVEIQVVKDFLAEGGGEGDFNWRGELWLEFMTEYSPTP